MSEALHFGPNTINPEDTVSFGDRVITIKANVDRIRTDILHQAQQRGNVDLHAAERAISDMPIMLNRQDIIRHSLDASTQSTDKLERFISLNARSLVENITSFSLRQIRGGAFDSTDRPALYLNLQNIVNQVNTITNRLPIEVHEAAVEDYLKQVYKHERDHIIRLYTPELRKRDRQEGLAKMITTQACILGAQQYLLRFHTDRIFTPLGEPFNNPYLQIILTTGMAVPWGLYFSNGLFYNFINHREKAARQQEKEGTTLPDLFDLQFEEKAY